MNLGARLSKRVALTASIMSSVCPHSSCVRFSSLTVSSRLGESRLALYSSEDKGGDFQELADQVPGRFFQFIIRCNLGNQSDTFRSRCVDKTAGVHVERGLRSADNPRQEIGHAGISGRDAYARPAKIEAYGLTNYAYIAGQGYGKTPTQRNTADG